MRPAALVRRSIAITAATALMSGGLASGFLPAPAQAAAGVITKVSPASWDNRSEVTITLTGSGFPLSSTLILRPACSDDPALPNATTMTVSDVNLAMAPPGRYHVILRNDIDDTTTSPFSYFKIFAYGAANATSTVAGVGDGGVDPFGVDCTVEISNTGCGRFNRLHPLDVRGSNIAIGAKVEFVKESDNAVDAGLTFTPGNPSNVNNIQGTAPGNDNTGYPSASVLQGDYTPVMNGADGTFTPGWHKVRVVNTDGRTGGSTARFSQPYFAPTASMSFPTAANPTPAPSNTIGQGAKNRVLRLTGQGFRAGSTLYVERKNTSSCGDVTVGATTLGGLQPDGLYTTLEAPLTFADCTSPNNTPRTVGVVGPDGGRFFRGGFLLIGGFPTFGSFEQGQYQTLGQGAHEGFDGVATDGVAILGSNFEGAGETDPAKMVSFDFGPGVTVTTRAVGQTGSIAFVSIDVASDAATGERTARATNPNGGSKLVDCDRLETGECDPTSDNDTAPLEITVGPKVTGVKVDPTSLTQSMTPGQSLPTKFNVTGSGFQSNGYSAEQFVVALPGQTTQDPKIEVNSVQRVSATQVNFLASALSGAAAGPRDLIIENDDHGRVICSACLGIDSLTVNPSSDDNGGPSSAITITVLPDGLPAFTSSSTVKLTHQTPLSGQPEIPGTSVTATGAKTGTAVFNLTDAAIGRYNVTLVLDPSAPSPTTVSCVGCFTVTGDVVTLDSTTPVTPAEGGQGASDWKLTFKGTGFTKGMQVSIPDVTVHDVTFVSATEITALVDIAENATTGAKTGSVTGGDGTTRTFTFTVNARPVVSGVSSGAAFGTGAGSPGSPTPVPAITVSGSDFDEAPDTQIDLGAKIEVTDEAVTKGDPPVGICPACLPGTDDTDTGSVAIDPTATQGKRPVTVVNPDGGRSTLADAFTVNPGPQISSIANESGQPALLQDGKKHTISVLGSAFPTPTTDPDKAAAFKITNVDGSEAAGITVENVQFTSGKITADVTAATNRTYGFVRVAIFNATDKGFVKCDTCVSVADPPGLPLNVKLSPLGRAIKVDWSAASANGAAITAYHLVRKDVATGATSTVDVSGSTRTVTFTGLTNGRKYEIAINAVNAAGPGPVVKKTEIAGVKTTLTLVRSRTLATYGTGVSLSGKLTTTSASGVTTALGSRTITLTFVPAKGSSQSKNVLTSSTGTWTFPAVKSLYNWSVTARYAGHSVLACPANDPATTENESLTRCYRPATTGPWGVLVASKVVRTFPSNGSSSDASTTLKIAGNVAPNASGRTVYLQRFVGGKWVTTSGKATLSGSSTFVISYKPGRGTYVFRVYMPKTFDLFDRNLNYQGYSAAFTLKRT